MRREKKKVYFMLTGVSGTVLLHVEDDDNDRRLFERCVRSALRPGETAPEIRAAGTLKQAVAMLSEASVTVAFVDLGLPDASGARGVRMINEAYPELPIVVLTGADDEPVIADVIAAGATELLSKNGLRPREVRRAIGYAIERKASEAERARLTAELARRERMWNDALEAAGQGVWYRDHALDETFYSTMWRQMRGIGPEELTAPSHDEWLARIHPDDRAFVLDAVQRHRSGEVASMRYEYRERRRDGEWIWIMSRGRIVAWSEDGTPARIAGTDTDITDMKKAQERAALHEAETYRLNLARVESAHLAAKEAQNAVESLARHDPLTGLPNRRTFMEFVNAATRSTSGDLLYSILIFDLDGFTAVNDIHGQEVGDALLRQVAARTRSVIEPDDGVMRIGPDEFAVAIRRRLSRHGDGDARQTAERVAQVLRAPFAVSGDVRLDVGVAIGVADIPQACTDAEEPIRAAGLAMRAARREPGSHNWREFHSSMEEELRASAELDRSVRIAVENGHIRPHFQPILHLKSERLAAFEVLSRWKRSDPIMVPPDSFLPAVKKIGLMSRFTYDVLVQACRTAADWPEEISISVNVFPEQLSDPAFPVRVLSILSETGFPARRLQLEITEEAVINDVEAAVATIDLLRGIGVLVSLDDFGTGYSNFDLLGKVTFDRLKIDKSFVTSMIEDVSRFNVVQSILDMARKFGVPVVAEGIETAAVARELVTSGCEFGQGYHFGAAMPPSDADALVWETFGIPEISRVVSGG